MHSWVERKRRRIVPIDSWLPFEHDEDRLVTDDARENARSTAYCSGPAVQLGGTHSWTKIRKDGVVAGWRHFLLHRSGW